MFTGTYALLMAEYNRWMNEKVYAAAATLTDEERKRDRGAFFKSIHGTLNHILWGDGAWLTRFNGERAIRRPRQDDGCTTTSRRYAPRATGWTRRSWPGRGR